MNANHPDIKRALQLWKHNKVNKREFKYGAQSAKLTAQQTNLRYAKKYLMSKLSFLSTFTPPDVLSYWQGYFEYLQIQNTLANSL